VARVTSSRNRQSTTRSQSRIWLLLAVLASTLTLAAQQPTRTDPIEVIRAFRRVAAPDLWPGFDPATTPVELFDGASTYLLNHPSPPDGFRPVAGQQNIYVYPGQHETVRANTGTMVSGVPTATADISGKTSSVDELASLLVHETVHVFQGRHYPNWGGNEMELFTYPVDNAELLAERRLESIALVRAVGATNQKDAGCWAATALALRSKRFAGLAATDAAYERGVELREGLAQYVEFKSIGKPAALTVEDFPPAQAQVRQRAYASGQALALLLDRTWISRGSRGSKATARFPWTNCSLAVCGKSPIGQVATSLPAKPRRRGRAPSATWPTSQPASAVASRSFSPLRECVSKSSPARSHCSRRLSTRGMW
jgi:hypothetical protein